VPHGWVTGDDEFGRASAFRAQLRLDGERYVLDVPCNTLVGDLSARHPAARPGRRARLPAFGRGAAGAAAAPAGRGGGVRGRDGANGPLQVRAVQQGVQTKDEDGCVGPRARLVVIRSCEPKPRTWYALSNAPKAVGLAQVVAAHGERHRVEELLEEGNSEVGL